MLSKPDQVTNIESDRITLDVPEGDSMHLSEGGPTVEFATESPQELATFINKGLSNAVSSERKFMDTWDDFTVVRKDQILGTIREIRDKHYLRNVEKYSQGGGSDEMVRSRKVKRTRKA